MKPFPIRLKVPSGIFSLISVILLATVGLSVISHPSPVKASSTLTFVPAADSYVNQSDPTKNFGTNKSIRVDGSPLVRSYLRFDVSGIYGNVTRVSLRIYANSSSTGGFAVDKVADNAWKENEITYNNAPAIGDEVGTSHGFSSNTWISVDVTPLLNTDGTVSIALLGIDQTAINLASREDTINGPQLLVEISSDASPTLTRTTLPSATATRTTVPSITPTSTTLPSATATSTSLPSATTTSISLPSATVPSTSLPSATATSTSLPSATATSTSLPSATATSTSLPRATVTSTSLPSATATSTSLPSATATSTMTPSATPTNPPNPTATPSGNDPIIFFTGDLVSGSTVSQAQAVVNLILNLMSQHPGTQMLVASTGDNEQEAAPTISNYTSYFGTTYGTFVAQGIFMQVRGNHDIQSVGSYTDFNGMVHRTGAAYWDYFGANAHMFNIEGKKLTDYSYDLGTWHIIGLDQLNGSINTATLNFLTSDLAAHNSSTCQLVYWHVPTYSSGAAQGDSPGLMPLNQAEYNAGVDIQINGHDHDYQRFYPINPNGVQDNTNGITTFIDGIGGQDGHSGSKTSIAQAASAVYLDYFPPGNGHAIGVIQFILHATSADYTLYDANNGSILDQGTVICH